jgi:thiol-disulfide isomerase/thioredoxin
MPAHAAPSHFARGPVALGGVVLAVLLIVAGILVLVGGSTSHKPSDSLVGTTLHGFSIPRVNGRGEVASPWSAGHATVVLFFAQWCAPCHREVPALASVIGRGDLGAVRVIGVDEDAQLGTARSFVRASGVRFPVGLDHLIELASVLVPGGLPGAVFVRANGKVAAVQYGPMTVLQLSAALSMLGRS